MSPDLGKLTSNRVTILKKFNVGDVVRWASENIISFGGGLPDPRTFLGEEEFNEILNYLREVRVRALQYSQIKGINELTSSLCKFLRRNEISAKEENIIITTGSQQALELIAKLLLEEGDKVGVELPTYYCSIQIFSMYGARYVGVPMDQNGMDTQRLEGILRSLQSGGEGIKLVYTLPVYQNPTGITMSEDRMKHLLELASKYDFLIVEDDAYSYISFGTKVPTKLKSLDSEGRVIYISTLSKILGPGLRIGWIVADEELTNDVAMLKMVADICTPSISQLIAHYALEKGVVERRLPTIRSIYKEKRNATIDSLEEFMPEGVSWTYPMGGFYVFLWLNRKIDTRKILPDVIQRYKVAYLPGDVFYVTEVRNTARLSYSYPTVEEIEEGIRRLAAAFKEMGIAK